MKKIDFGDLFLSIIIIIASLFGFGVIGFIVLGIIAGIFRKFLFETLLIEKSMYFIFGYIILAAFIILLLFVKWFKKYIGKPVIMGIIIVGVPIVLVFVLREIIARNIYFVLIITLVGAYSIFYLITDDIKEFSDGKNRLKDNLPLIIAILGFLILLWFKFLGISLID